MPTMIQRFECEPCHEVYKERTEADACAQLHVTTSDGLVPPDTVPDVTVLDLWECDGENCQLTYDDQWSAQQCEAAHETEDAAGRQGPDPRKMDGNTAMDWASAVIGRKS